MAKFIAVLAASVVLADAVPGGLRSEAQNETGNMTEDLEGFADVFVGNMTLTAEASAEAAVEAGKCQGSYMGAIEGLAPGCLGQCYSRGICGALNHAIAAYGKKKDRAAAKSAVCAHKGAFVCLMEGSHRNKCRAVISQAARFGLPSSAGAIYGRCH